MKRRMKQQSLMLVAAMMVTSCHTQRTIFMAGDSTYESAIATLKATYQNRLVKFDNLVKGL